MRSVTIIPNQKKVSASDVDEIRARQAMKCLWELVAAAKTQVDLARWIVEGGLEAEELLMAIDKGHPHAALKKWEKTARKNAHRPGPSMREQNARRIIVLLCEALTRAGFTKRESRKRAAAALAQARIWTKPISPHAIGRWEGDYVHHHQFDVEALAQAHARCRGQPELLTKHFIGIARLALDPLAKIIPA